ncbi:hypothetical protein E2C01_064839 [Portunus trituberculatus]|uniref:Uncharacterized protein n=1 Tax=Portunus trituberculatus TaxID=210409 RepID=A0A5B7HPH0_PORTR|nr:hypothetical protein [Portunus trituberculatus]
MMMLRVGVWGDEQWVEGTSSSKLVSSSPASLPSSSLLSALISSSSSSSASMSATENLGEGGITTSSILGERDESERRPSTSSRDLLREAASPSALIV